MEPTQEYLIRRYNYNPDTGILTWCLPRSSKYGKQVGRPRKINNTWYLDTWVMGKKRFVHRIIWTIAYGEVPSLEIDHEDGDGTNNRLSNLRLVPHATNLKNCRMSRNNTSGHTGVRFCKERRKWCSFIHNNGVMINLGRFDDKLKAIAARKDAERLYGFHETHGEIRTK